MPRRSGLIVPSVAAGLLLVAGCATVRPAPELLWPAPPETARIKFVGLLRGPQDLGRSVGARVLEALVGATTASEAVRWPMGMATSRDGTRLYVADQAQNAVIIFDFESRRVWPLGEPTGGFEAPFGVAVDDRDNLYVVDTGRKVIQVFNPTGGYVRSITHESLERPTGIAVDPSRDRIYVADSSSLKSDNHAVRIFDAEGRYIGAIGGRGDGKGQFFFPAYLALDRDGNLYVSDTMNGRVQVLSPEGLHLKTFGARGDALGMFNRPKGVALDAYGNVYVVDSGWSTVQIFNQGTDVLLFFGGAGRYPGLLYSPTAIAIDRDNRIYVADPFNSRICVYQLINTSAEDSS